MIKRILPFVAVLLLQVSATAHAQTKNNPLTEAREHRWDLPVAPMSAEKTSAVTGSRLIKSAWGPFANGGFLFRDSSNYQYRPTMGMHPIIGWMFDTMTTQTRYPHITRNSVRSLHTFNTAGLITDMEEQWWDSVNNSWFGVSRLKHDYTSGKLLSSARSLYVSGTWKPTTKTEYYTNTVTNTSTTLLQQWDAGQNKWIYLTREVTKYNSMGPDTIWKENYSGSSWVPERITAYTYNNGKATLIERTLKSGSGWGPDYKETNTYNSNGQLTETVFQSYSHLIGSWNDPMKEEYSYDADGNRSETVTYNWASGAYVRSSKTTAMYNSYKQVLTSTTQTWDGMGNWYYSSNDIQSRYYYEDYTTDINKLAKAEMEIKLCPVPATDVLHVALNGYRSVSLSLIDMQGRVVKQLLSEDMHNGVIAVPVNDLAAGMYLLKAENEAGVAIRRFSIIR